MSAKRPIITIGGKGGGSIATNQPELYQYNLVKVFEKPFPTLPKDKQGNRPKAFWQVESPNCFNLDKKPVEIHIPAGQTVKVFSSLEANRKIRGIVAHYGVSTFFDDDQINTWETMNKAYTYAVYDAENEKVFKVYRGDNGNYWIDVVQLHMDGTETLLSQSDTGIAGYGNSQSYYNVIKVGDKFVFIGRSTNADFRTFRVFEVNNDVINWLGNAYEHEEGPSNSNMSSVLDVAVSTNDAFVMRGRWAGYDRIVQLYRVRNVNNEWKVERVTGDTFTDLNKFFRIKNGYIGCFRSNTNMVAVYKATSSSLQLMKTEYYDNFYEARGVAVDEEDGHFMVLGRDGSTTDQVFIQKWRYDDDNNTIIHIGNDTRIIDKELNSLMNALSLLNLGNNIFLGFVTGGTRPAYHLRYVQFDIDLNVIGGLRRLYGSVYYGAMYAVATKQIVPLVQEGTINLNRLYDVDNDGTIDVLTVDLTKKLNGQAFSDWDELSNRDINSKNLYFEYVIQNTNSYDVKLLFDSTKSLILNIE